MAGTTFPCGPSTVRDPLTRPSTRRPLTVSPPGAALIVAVLLTIHAIPHRLRLFSRLSNPPRLPFSLALRCGFNIAQFVFWVACVAQLRTTPWNYLSNSNNVVTAYQAAEGLAITAM